MKEIEKLLAKYDLAAQKDEQLDLPHIMYERRGIQEEIVVSRNFIVEYKMLVQKGYIHPEDLENSFYMFEKQFFSKYFFREDTDLKWNYYLMIIVDEAEEENDSIAQLENDEKFLRKLVMTVDELEIYIGHGKTRDGTQGGDVTGIDTYGEWLKNLGSRNLDGILTCSFENSKVQGYIDKDMGIRPQGRPISNWDTAESSNAGYLVEKIDSLHLEKFREHCLAENQEIKLSRVNLLSGSNGSGKSSLCAAIEYAMTGEISGNAGEGSTSVIISNRSGGQSVLKSGLLTKEKKELDRLWYGTAATAHKSDLNRHFHAFNYLGLEAAGEYIAKLEINELVKNVLFGTEVTEAEKKMQRYGAEFADRKRGFDRQIKEINAAIMERAKEETGEDLPKEEILRDLRLLGYKRSVGEEDVQGYSSDTFLKKLLEIVILYQKDAEHLTELCEEEENGREILRQKTELLEKYHSYQENQRKLQFVNQRQEKSRKIIQKYDKKLSEVSTLRSRGEGMEKLFFGRWDFLEQDNEYRQNAEKKERLERWLEEYSILPAQEENHILVWEGGNILVQAEGNQRLTLNQLELRIEEIQTNIRGLRQEIEQADKEIHAQKALRDSVDIVMQEIHALSERYIKSRPDAVNCPMCGAVYKDTEELTESFRKHRKYEQADGELLQLLLNTKSEKERAAAAENDLLQEMIRKKILLQKTQTASAKLRSLMDVEEHIQGVEIEKIVKTEIEKLQNWLYEHERVNAYVKVVQSSDELAEYDGSLEWMEYLDRTADELKQQIERETKQIKEQETQVQELQQQAAEDGVFPEEEWQTCQLKLSACENLARDWNIDDTMPLVQWAGEFRNFTRKVEYAQELYRRQREYIEGRMYVEKLQKDKEELEKKSRRCQEAYELISSQRKLEDIMKDFLSENEKQIELYFKLLHRPKEFGTLRICDGKISIVRNSNGKTVECTQMSTGQRMALAFSIMITLHKNAPNAPKFLMLDEPVANLDDMHVLNLIDLLRELAIGGTQIIITTADSQMAKYLRRKFSFLQREYTHFELVRKGSEKTDIRENHYSPEKKTAFK